MQHVSEHGPCLCDKRDIPWDLKNFASDGIGHGLKETAGIPPGISLADHSVGLIKNLTRSHTHTHTNTNTCEDVGRRG